MFSDETYKYSFKIILLGDSGVGKSSFCSLFFNNYFPADHSSTIGVEFGSKIIKLQDGNNVKMMLWDTAGQERFRSITKSYYIDIVGAFLIFDLTNIDSFLNLNYWIEQINSKINNKCGVIYILGNKTDSLKKRQVHNEEIIEYINNIKTNCIIKYFETSFKNNQEKSISLFNDIAEDININYSLILKDDEVNEKKEDGIKLNNTQKKCCYIM